MTLRELWGRLGFLFRRARFERELKEELRLHADLRAEKLRAAGMTAPEADTAARRRLGNATLLAEQSRDAWTFAWLEATLQDLRYAARVLRKSPAFAATAALTLALGLGLNTTLFTVFNALVLRPFAVRDPFSLYEVEWSSNRAGQIGLSWEEFVELRDQKALLTDAAAVARLSAGVDKRWTLSGMAVSGNYFTMLGAETILGRPILEPDAAIPGEGAVLVISYHLWRNRLGGDPAVIGKKLLVNGHPFEVIGVLPAEFEPLEARIPPFEFWIPLSVRHWITANPHLEVIARLKPGVPPRKAEAALLPYARHATSTRPPESRATTVTLRSRATREELSVGKIMRLMPLVVSFALVLLICCANVANMMLARGLNRQREIGVRLSLGASRSRVTRQLLAEGFLIAVTAGLAGLGIARASIDLGLRAANYYWKANVPGRFVAAYPVIPLPALPLDTRVFAFALAVAAFVTVAFALAPALQATRPGVSLALRGEFGGVRPSRLRGLLLASQVAVCLLLLITTGLLLRGTVHLRAVDPGFDVRGVFKIEVSKALALETEPIVSGQGWAESVAFASRVPLDTVFPRLSAGPADRDETMAARYNFVSPEYFSALRIPVVRGRTFTEQEARTEASVVVVSESVAKRLWPGEDAVGKVIRIDPSQARPGQRLPPFSRAEVVGVVGGVADHLISVDRNHVYFPAHLRGSYPGSLLVRGKPDPRRTAQLLDALLTQVVPPDEPAAVVPLATLLEVEILPVRIASLVSSLLGGLALVVTVSGVYGVVSYLVSRRAKEIGIRMALGATSGGVVRFVLGQSMKQAAAGMVLGMVLALAASKLLSATIIGRMNLFDLVAYAGGSLLVALAAILAALGPARRASRVDPATTLRAE